VGFGDKRPPAPVGGDTGDPVPRFVPQDESGRPILDDDGLPIEDAPPQSPVLEVTQGYIRFHLLQGNSNDGPGGVRDPNGGDVVLLEVYPVTEGMLGDYDGNGELGLGDLNLQAVAIAGGEHPTEFDLTGDNLVDYADRLAWVNDLKNTWIGDSNLDLEFNSGDMVQVFTAGKYEKAEDAGWEEGDWDASLRFDSGDMVAAFVEGGYEQGKKALPAAAVSAVPEPCGWLLLALGMTGLLATCRRS
jgi:hypothetical protein